LLSRRSGGVEKHHFGLLMAKHQGPGSVSSGSANRQQSQLLLVTTALLNPWARPLSQAA
jgi:hypothetical protein